MHEILFWCIEFEPFKDALKNICNVDTKKSLRLVQGSHIVVKKIYEGDQAYILQLQDRRIIFLIPYQNKYTLIGTTDKEVSSYLNPEITGEEKKYLIDSANTFLKSPITEEDIVWTYAGIRPLLNDQNSNASKVTRDYEFDLDSKKAPIISIFGGKLTTYRKLAEHALQKLSEVMPIPNQTWTDKEKLPGSKKISEKYFENLSLNLQKRIFDNYGDQVVTLNNYYKKLRTEVSKSQMIYMSLRLLT